MFIVGLITVANYENNLHVCQHIEWIKKIWYICTMKFYSDFKKEVNPSICNNMGKSEGHYTKWNKPDTKRQISHDLTYMQIFLKKSNSKDY